MTLVSQAVFARMCKTSPKTVTKWKQEGRLVIQGAMVDVEATDKHMKRFRRRGSPIVLTVEEAREPGNNNRGKGNERFVTPVQGNGRIVTLRCAEIAERLRFLDWTQEFEWTPQAELERARGAAICIGWEVVQSDLRDDGHWGGLQLRITEHVAKHGLTEDAIPAGFGFELFPAQILERVREEIEPMIEFDDDVATVDLALLPLLARPFFQLDRSSPSGLNVLG
jgi:hypothetical protein